jgi:hypothetical protein
MAIVGIGAVGEASVPFLFHSNTYTIPKRSSKGVNEKKIKIGVKF